MERENRFECITLYTVTHEDLNANKVCAHRVPRDLTQAQKDKRVEDFRWLLELISLGFTVLVHLSYSPDLATCDYVLFDNMMVCLRGCKVANSEELQEAVHE